MNDKPLFGRAYLERAADGTDAPLVFTASTPGVKRDGLDLRASGWRIDTFQHNPVCLWAHDRRSLPLGRVNASVEPDRLRAEVVFDRDDEFAAKVESKYRRGFLNAVSVGWDFVDARGERLDWWRLSEEQIRDEAFYDLTELSCVPVPADPQALAARQREALGHLGRELVDIFDEQERSTDVTAEQVQAAVAAELERLGIDTTPKTPSDATEAFDEDAVRTLRAAFTSLEGDHRE